MVGAMTTWAELELLAPDLVASGRTLLINCAPEWGIALLGTLRRDGSPRIGPLCVYALDGGLFVTVEGEKERDLRRDGRYFLHSYWGDGQDEFAVAGVVSSAIDDARRRGLIELSPRIQHSPVIRELGIDSAHSVKYRNFPRADMYAEVVSWHDGEVRRWRRSDPPPSEDQKD